MSFFGTQLEITTMHVIVNLQYKLANRIAQVSFNKDRSNVAKGEGGRYRSAATISDFMEPKIAPFDPSTTKTIEVNMK